mmetsp:Transcript_52320/g.150771  ORF Transcript_52320/g.150771 Transcript_52320/m.150771 type:complete len:203 (+) Transcript_52320:604-1212(+)
MSQQVPTSPYMKDSKPKYLIIMSYSGRTSSEICGSGAGRSGLDILRKRKCESNFAKSSGSTSKNIRPSASRLCPWSKLPENIPASSEPLALHNTARVVLMGRPPTFRSTTSSMPSPVLKMRASISSNCACFSSSIRSAAFTSSKSCSVCCRSLASRAANASVSCSTVASSKHVPALRKFAPAVAGCASGGCTSSGCPSSNSW